MDLFSVLIALLIIICLVLYIWAVADLIKHRRSFDKRRHQGLWLMFIVFVPVIGSVVYLSLKQDIMERERGKG